MNKIFLIIQREFLNRVQKKSFLAATILIPLIFPGIIAILVFVAKQEEASAQKEVMHYVDETGLFLPDLSKYIFLEFNGSIDDAKAAFSASNDFGLLYIPDLEIYNPRGITLYTKVNPSLEDINGLENWLEGKVSDLKMERLSISQGRLDSLRTSVSISTVNLTDNGQEASSNSGLLFGIGMAAGILMYMFIFIYGAQIMQGVIEEKTSKVVEVIISSVKPFHLMMGKIIGLASVGLLQFLIWIVLMTTLTFGVLGFFGIDPPQQQAMEQISGSMGAQPDIGNSEFVSVFTDFMQLPWGFIVFTFLFFFLGGYLIYGALFAAVGSAVDSPAEAQQFMFPITIPMLISYMSLFMFILPNPHGALSVWLSIIPLTSPIAMIGRIGFGVPLWQLILSMGLLIAGFILTTWVAGRIYRVGILMHGTKVSYKVLAKWFLMRG